MNREQIENEIKMYADSKITASKMKKAGLPIPPKPTGAEEDSQKTNGDDIFIRWEKVKKKHGGIANIPFSILGDFLDEWTSILAYARWCEAIADIDQATAREIRDTIKQQLYTLQDGSREVRAALVAVEPLYREWEKKYTEALALLLATQALRQGYEQRANAISREITRRGNDVLDTRRASNRGNS